MATPFLVAGGTGNWNSTTNWSTTSGGSSGAPVPIAGDTVTFDSNSGSATLAVSGGGDPTIKSSVTLNDNINISAGSGSNLTISGSVTGNDHNITVSGVGNTSLTGGVSTTGNLIKNDTGVLEINHFPKRRHI